MSSWIINANPKNTPVNLDMIYTFCHRDYTPEGIAAIEAGNGGYAKGFSIYFYPSACMAEEECAVSWTFVTYDEMVSCYEGLVAYLGAPCI